MRRSKKESTAVPPGLFRTVELCFEVDMELLGNQWTLSTGVTYGDIDVGGDRTKQSRPVGQL
jgi:hypothetical protein